MKTMCGICKTPMDQSKPIQFYVFFAVQAMAAELATGALVMFQIQKSRKYRCLLLTTKGILQKKQPEELLLQ
jgi:hypothetical protein